LALKKPTRSPFNINRSHFTIKRTFFATVEIVLADHDSRKERSIDSKMSMWYRYGEIVPNSAFLVFEFRIQNLKLARKSGPGFALTVLSRRSGLFAWPISTIGANRDSRKEGSFKKNSGVAINQ
jgi:hypothetical protein